MKHKEFCFVGIPLFKHLLTGLTYYKVNVYFDDVLVDEYVVMASCYDDLVNKMVNCL